jgi:hypothetical protein
MTDQNGNGAGPDHPPALDLPPDDWAHAFFAAYISDIGLGTISKSCAHAGVHPNAVKKRLADDALFRALKQQADEALLEALEFVAFKRAKNGTQRPVFQHGEIVGHVNEVDNRLLQWLLERLAPEKYHIATRIEHVNPDTPGAFTFRLGDRAPELEAGE